MARRALSRDEVVDAAVRVADDGGLAAVSMRHVGRALGVEAMSLYHHVRSKDDLLDALADWPFGQIWTPAADDPWRPAMARRASSAREVLRAHPWAQGLVESRAPGRALLRHHDALLGCLYGNGFPPPLAAHAFSAIDAYVYGFALTEQTVPMDPDASPAEAAAALGLDPSGYPHLAVYLQTQAADYRFATEFDYGLDLLLEALEARLASSSGPLE